jgi:hypothetical protein
LDLTPVCPHAAEEKAVRDLSAVPPGVALKAIEGWITEHPTEYDEAVGKLQDFVETVRGTALQSKAEKLIREVRARKTAATRPKTPEERKVEAARAYTKVMTKIIREPDRLVRNIQLLENLLETCKGTPYEGMVASKLKSMRQKANPGGP